MSKEITGKTKRIAQILSLLEQAPVTVADLAAHFGVSIRTIQRDIGLLVQAQFPVISPRQSVYELAPGFSLAAANLSGAQAALYIVAADISQQIGGDFGHIPGQISQRFAHPSFSHCTFGASKYDFAQAEEPATILLKCIKYHSTLRVYLKDCKKNRTLYPYILLRLYDKWYVVSVSSKREIACYALANIGHFSLREDRNTSTGYAQFRPIPFMNWAIWQRAHQWVKELAPQTSAATTSSPAEPLPAPTQNSSAPVSAPANKPQTLAS